MQTQFTLPTHVCLSNTGSGGYDVVVIVHECWGK